MNGSLQLDPPSLYLLTQSAVGLAFEVLPQHEVKPTGQKSSFQIAVEGVVEALRETLDAEIDVGVLAKWAGDQRPEKDGPPDTVPLADQARRQPHLIQRFGSCPLKDPLPCASAILPPP